MNLKPILLSLGVFTLAPLVQSCSGVTANMPAPTNALVKKEARAQEKLAFTRYYDMSKRLALISAAVMTANADLCDKTAPALGFTTHSTNSYPKALRPAAGRYLGAGETPTIYIVLNENAAVKAGDTVLGTDNAPISAAEASALLKDGGALTVRSADGQNSAFTAPQNGNACAYPVRLKFSSAINAYATGKSIIVTTGMMEFTTSDDELALVVGHELAHNTERHVRKSIWNMLVSGYAHRYTRPFEAEADYIGLYYMARAGFDMQDAALFWRRLGAHHPKNIVKEKTHPVTPKRLLSIQMAAAEIQNKQDAGEPLIPNRLPKKK